MTHIMRTLRLLRTIVYNIIWKYEVCIFLEYRSAFEQTKTLRHKQQIVKIRLFANTLIAFVLTVHTRL